MINLKTVTLTRQANIFFVVLLSIILIIFLTLLHNNLYPTVFADEWIYSSSARLIPLSESVTTSYLYLLLFKTTNYCGPHFLSCARIMNAFFFTLALPFIYLIGRKVTTRTTALYIGVFSLLSPINSYTAYFMPESLYFLTFWIFAWFSITHYQKNPVIFGSALGLIISIMSLIKVHAIFLLPSAVVFLLWLKLLHSIKADNSKVILSIFYMLIAFLISRELLGYTFAGKPGLDLIGIKYHYNAVSLLNMERLLNALWLIKTPLLGHLSALIVCFSVPLLTLSRGIQKNISEQKPNMIIAKIFLVSCIIPLFFMTILTTAQIVGWDPYESINRIHLRYYNFIFPLFYIIAADELSSVISYRQFSKYVLLILVCLAYSYAVVYLINHNKVSFIDCPELFGFLYNNTLFIIISSLGIFCSILWIITRNWGSKLYVFVFLPFFIIFSNYYVNIELQKERLHFTDAYDKAGLFAHHFFGKESSHLLIIGSERGGLYKTLFYLDNPKTSISELPANVPIEFAKIPADTEWILFIGDHPMLRKPLFQLSMGDYTITKLKP